MGKGIPNFGQETQQDNLLAWLKTLDPDVCYPRQLAARTNLSVNYIHQLLTNLVIREKVIKKRWKRQVFYIPIRDVKEENE